MVDLTALSFGTKIIFQFAFLIALVPLSALALWLTGKIFKEKIGYLKSLLPASIISLIGGLFSIPSLMTSFTSITIIMGVVSFLVNLALYLLLPKLFFRFGWKRGLLIGIVWYAMILVVGFALGIVVAAAIVMLSIAANVIT
jgi:hypothetical protein